MKYIIDLMNMEEAVQVSKWKYEEPYSIYSMDESEECINEFINEKFYSVKDEENKLLGYFCFGNSAQVPVGRKFGAYEDKKFTDIGLGINPNFCGQGMGYEFLKEGIKFAKNKLSFNNYRLTVAEFNIRAIKVYEKLGFKEVMKFTRDNENGTVNFIVMLLE